MSASVGNYNDSVCITLETSDWRDEWMSLESDGGVEVTTSEFQDAANHWLNEILVRGHVLTTSYFQLILAVWLSGSEA